MKRRHVLMPIARTASVLALSAVVLLVAACAGEEAATTSTQAITTATQATTTTEVVTTTGAVSTTADVSTTQATTAAEAAGATSTTSLPAPTVAGTIAFSKVTDVKTGALTLGWGDIWVINTDGSGLKQLTATSDVSEDWPVWSPDGTKIAFSGGDPTGNYTNYTLRFVNADGSGSGPLTGKVMAGGNLSWSPDGTRIAFEFFTSPHTLDAMVMNSDGSGVQAVTSSPKVGSFPRWLPDGTLLFLNMVFLDAGDIYRVNADGSGLTAVTTGGYVRFYALSPDGKQLAIYDYLGDRLVLLPATGGGTPAVLVEKVSRYVPNDRVSLSWSPDGKALAFAGCLMDNLPGGGSPLYIVNADGSGLSKVPNVEHVADVSWRPE